MQVGIGKKQELIDAYERFSLKYDSTRSPQKMNNMNGFSFMTFQDQVKPQDLSAKEKVEYQLLQQEFSSFLGFDGPSQKSFFKKGRLFEFQNSEVHLRVDPLLFLSVGSEKQSEFVPFRNTRGIQVSGDFGKKVFFRTSILENQARFLTHIENRVLVRNAIPGQGFYKRYQSNIIDDINGWDFLNAEAVLTYRPSKYFRASIGHGSHFLGSGYNSLLLSDYANNFFYVEFNTTIGAFNYKNVFAELAPIGSTIDQVGDPLAPKKYIAAHYLSFALSKKLEISLFESVIFGRQNNFEFQYLNPIILYRAVEQKLDSPDNVMLGIDMNYIAGESNRIYGQIIIDEMRVGELFSGNGWWGNKIGFQLGMKSFNLFNVDYLDLQLEFNTVRPYTYTHRASTGLDYTIASYTHYNQELAHPLGANFREWLLLLKYRLSKKWSFSSKAIFAQVGKSNLLNVGQDITQPSDTRLDDFNNRTGQGESVNIFQFSNVLTYHISNGFFVDTQFLYRSESSIQEIFNVKSTYFGVSFRSHLSFQKLDY